MPRASRRKFLDIVGQAESDAFGYTHALWFRPFSSLHFLYLLMLVTCSSIVLRVLFIREWEIKAALLFLGGTATWLIRRNAWSMFMTAAATLKMITKRLTGEEDIMWLRIDWGKISRSIVTIRSVNFLELAKKPTNLRLHKNSSMYSLKFLEIASRQFSFREKVFILFILKNSSLVPENFLHDINSFFLKSFRTNQEIWVSVLGSKENE